MGLFVIIGDIGVGKSILFDVICLVFYNKIVRLCGDIGNKIDFNGDNIKFNDLWNLLCCGVG